jgi:hypothetical protein
MKYDNFSPIFLMKQNKTYVHKTLDEEILKDYVLNSTFFGFFALTLKRVLMRYIWKNINLQYNRALNSQNFFHQKMLYSAL